MASTGSSGRAERPAAASNRAPRSTLFWFAKPVVQTKGAPTPATPGLQRALAVLAAQCRAAGEKQAEDYCAVVGGQIDQLGLHDKSTQLDQLARPLAPLHDPVATIFTRQFRVQPIASCAHPPLSCRQLSQRSTEGCPASERKSRPAVATPPWSRLPP